MNVPFEIMARIFEVKSMDDGGLLVEGYASTFDDIDRQGDTIDHKAFDASIERYMQNPILLAFHDQQKPIGHVQEATIDQKGLYAKAVVSNKADQAIREQIKAGFLRHFSIGGYFYRTQKDGHTHIKSVDLKEISIVAVPANPYASFNVSGAMEKSMDYKSMPSQMEYGQPVAFGAKSLDIPPVSVTVEGAGTDAFLGYWFGTKSMTGGFYQFQIEPKDIDHLRYQLKQIESFANRTGAIVTVDVPDDVKELL